MNFINHVAQTLEYKAKVGILEVPIFSYLWWKDLCLENQALCRRAPLSTWSTHLHNPIHYCPHTIMFLSVILHLKSEVFIELSKKYFLQIILNYIDPTWTSELNKYRYMVTFRQNTAKNSNIHDLHIRIKQALEHSGEAHVDQHTYTFRERSSYRKPGRNFLHTQFECGVYSV